MSEDIRKEPIRRRRPEPPADEPDDREFDYGEEPPFPPLVKAAGWMWIAFGCIVFVNMIVVLVLSFAAGANQQGPAGASTIGGGVCAAVFIALFGAAFLFVGNQSVRGTARDTLGNGIGSIIFGVLYLGASTVQIAFAHIVDAAVGAVGALLLLAAGVLALAGRGQYRMWKKWQKAQKDRETADRKARRRERGW